VKIKMRRGVSGSFHIDAGTGKGWSNGVAAGEVIDLDPAHAKRYIESGLAVAADDSDAHF
jgi:hypothetical protein